MGEIDDFLIDSAQIDEKTGEIDDFLIDSAQIDKKMGGIDDFLVDSAQIVAIVLILRLIQGLLDVGNQILLVFQSA